MMYSIGFFLVAFVVQSIYGDLVHGKLIHSYFNDTEWLMSIMEF